LNATPASAFNLAASFLSSSVMSRRLSFSTDGEGGTVVGGVVSGVDEDGEDAESLMVGERGMVAEASHASETARTFVAGSTRTSCSNRAYCIAPRVETPPLHRAGVETLAVSPIAGSSGGPTS
jgi:hypothetical protein